MKNRLAKALALASLPFLYACGTPPATTDLDNNRPYRHLTSGEVALARTIFGNQINYGDVRIYRQEAGNDRSEHLNGNLYMGHVKYTEDYSRISDLEKQVPFIHELVHVWQFQSGQDMSARSVEQFFIVGAGDNRYDIHWGNVRNFEKAGLEQQAKIVQLHFHMSALAVQDNDTKYCEDIARLQENLVEHFPAIRIRRDTARVCGL